MKTQAHPKAFAIRPNPAAPIIRFDAREMSTGSGDCEFMVFPCDDDEQAFINAAKRGYTVPEILDYYLVQSGFPTIKAAAQGMHDFFNDLTGCAVSQN